jgi:hypothetical protein
LPRRNKVKEVNHDEFIYVEMALGARQKVGEKVMECSLKLRYFVTKANLYVMILGSYDVLINMNWLESHEGILNGMKKRLSLIDDEG